MREESGRVLIFGGTTEGRTAAERLLNKGVPCTVSVATPYGEEVLRPHPLMRVRTGRMDRAGMAQMMKEERFVCVIDATHPYAQIVSGEIEAACGETGIPCLRLMREGVDAEGESHKEADAVSGDGTCVYVRDIDEAGAFLASVQGHILVTTGSKELVRFAEALGDPSRITARVLPAQESLRACCEAGLTGRQIIAMQGPFDAEMNCAHIRYAGASWLMTKESGAAGGYPDKIEAASRCGIRAVVIRVPSGAGSVKSLGSSQRDAAAEAVRSRSGPGAHPLNTEQAIEAALRYFDRDKGGTGRTLYLVGTGVGAPEAATSQAREAIAKAQVLFGAGTVLDNLAGTWKDAAGKTAVPVYDCEGVLRYLAGHPQIRTAAVAYSGDSGFYSGAASMLEGLREAGYDVCDRQGAPDAGPGAATRLDVRVICGVSSVSWFASKAGIPWQNWKILSSHGRFCNVTGYVRRNRECFLLLSGAQDLRETGERLAKAQKSGVLGALRLIYGYELSRPAEEIRECSAQELAAVRKEGLYVLYICHEDAGESPVLPGLPDSAFVRGKAPMTSSEIRALSLCRLGLTEEAVIWDVGAGSGSVSVEAAMTCPGGRVWSVEQKEEALHILRENRAKFCLQNMEIIEGHAPEALEGLPAPTHVFVGGSGGEIGAILRAALARNPRVRVVVNCITSETLAALKASLEELPVRDLVCTQVTVNREEMLGRYHYLRAANPVFIISFTGAGEG